MCCNEAENMGLSALEDFYVEGVVEWLEKDPRVLNHREDLKKALEAELPKEITDVDKILSEAERRYKDRRFGRAWKKVARLNGNLENVLTRRAQEYLAAVEVATKLLGGSVPMRLVFEVLLACGKDKESNRPVAKYFLDELIDDGYVKRENLNVEFRGRQPTAEMYYSPTKEGSGIVYSEAYRELTGRLSEIRESKMVQKLLERYKGVPEVVETINGEKTLPEAEEGTEEPLPEPPEPDAQPVEELADLHLMLRRGAVVKSYIPTTNRFKTRWPELANGDNYFVKTLRSLGNDFNYQKEKYAIKVRRVSDKNLCIIPPYNVPAFLEWIEDFKDRMAEFEEELREFTKHGKIPPHLTEKEAHQLAGYKPPEGAPEPDFVDSLVLFLEAPSYGDKLFPQNGRQMEDIKDPEELKIVKAARASAREKVEDILREVESRASRRKWQLNRVKDAKKLAKCIGMQVDFEPYKKMVKKKRKTVPEKRHFSGALTQSI